MIISIASGKGGTGKTLVATSLARSLKDRSRVQLLDCDVEEPNDHVFLKPVITRSEIVSIPVPKVDEEKCTYCGKCAEVCAYNAIAVMKQKVLVFPELCHGCGACSYLCPEKAISEEAKEIGVVESGYSDGVGDRKVEEYCQKENIPILLTIPLNTKIASFYSKGVTLVESMPQWKDNFLGLFDKIREIANERSRGTER